MFFDQVIIEVKAGNGGDGAVSFRREKYVPEGGPDGGDGGQGGDIYLRVNPGINTLQHYRYARKFKAASGENGMGKMCYGKSADHLYLEVPQGTLVYDADSGELLADLTDENEEFLLVKGGQGGLGNSHFKTSVRQAPRFARAGGKGEKKSIKLELKLIADVGLIGFPNVGKSTLLSVVTAAKPKIADYPFTTLTPQLGVVTYADVSFVMADMPGLIEGAAQGIGLGHDFLRHIERTRIFLQVIDPTMGDFTNIIKQFELIEFELGEYQAELLERKRLVVINKIDAADEKLLAGLQQEFESRGFEVFLISAATRKNVDQLIAKTAEYISELPPIPKFKIEDSEHKTYRYQAKELFKIHFDGEFFVVDSEWAERLVRSTDFNDNEAFFYFQRLIKRRGLDQALADAGLENGDWVKIGNMEFQWLDE